MSCSCGVEHADKATGAECEVDATLIVFSTPLARRGLITAKRRVNEATPTLMSLHKRARAFTLAVANEAKTTTTRISAGLLLLSDAGVVLPLSTSSPPPPRSPLMSVALRRSYSVSLRALPSGR